jgi:hypothetical protein
MDSLKIPTTPQNPLPDRITRWIREDGGDHALLLITVDGYIRPHIMMLARDEVAVISGTHLKVALGERTQSAENLRLRASATIAIYDADLACVIKTRVTSALRPLMPGKVACDLAIEDIRLDTPAADEATARLATGLRFEGRAARDDIQSRLRNA